MVLEPVAAPSFSFSFKLVAVQHNCNADIWCSVLWQRMERIHSLEPSRSSPHRQAFRAKRVC